MTRALNLLCLAVYLFLLAPIAVVVIASFNAGGFLTFPPQGLTRTGMSARRLRSDGSSSRATASRK